MAITDYQAAYLAHDLTRQAASDSMDKLAAAVAGAQVDLNPHQVDAALFAFTSPLSKGAILADEVGLGKTIEAGLVLAQHWAELKRRLIIICPANLRKQWHQELAEKFFLPARILEKKTFDAAISNGQFNPFDDASSIVICSIEFARGKAPYVQGVSWDLVVVDEAHRLRNVWKSDNKVARAIRSATKERNKLLLTATPLQNSLEELYGLTTFIDERLFGSIETFREQYVGRSRTLGYDDLRSRLKPIATRTLRKQVQGYVSFTQRRSIVEEFMPGDQEDTLYELVSEYLRRPNLQALPSGQRSLITMALRKLLASSTFAIAGALNTMATRLDRELHDAEASLDRLTADLEDDIESLESDSDEWSEEPAEALPRPGQDVAAIRAEVRELQAFRDLATGIETNAKGQALLKVLVHAMNQVAENKGPRKAIIFTESRKTQSYLQRILADTEWRDGIVLFNGSNSDPKSREIAKAWMAKHEGTDRVVDSAAANMRQALVDYFRDEGQIMIATEAAAEGINLQFCALVINYDLPWNPQRIEQRIGRCHRYGQKHDVVVVNFLNQKNEADQRVYELLKNKFHLFDGVFGASDDPLGQTGSGVEFEKRVLALYQNCRTTEEIEAEYQRLQAELAPEIDRQMEETNQKLLANFDDEVREKLRQRQEASSAALNRYEERLMQVTRHELHGIATFPDPNSHRFHLDTHPFDADIPLGWYELPRRSDDAHIYRPNSPLAEAVLATAKGRVLPSAEVRFTRSGRVSAIEPFVGSGGVLTVDLLEVFALGQTEQRLIVSAVADSGEIILPEHADRLLGFPAEVIQEGITVDTTAADQAARAQQLEIAGEIATRNLQYFTAETEKLDQWADDLKDNLEREITQIDREIREARRHAKAALTLEAKLDAQKAVKALESRRSARRRSLFEAQDDIDTRRDTLIADIESRLNQGTNTVRLFAIRWSLA